MLTLGSYVSIFNFIVLVSGIGYFTSIIQKFTVMRLKDNVQIAFGQLFLEFTIVIVTVLFTINNSGDVRNSLVTDTCRDYINVNEDQKQSVDYVFALISKTKTPMNFQILVSAVII